LNGFTGILQVDGYAGYNRLIAPDRVGQNIQLAYCWAHARRKLVEIARNGPAPIAEEGLWPPASLSMLNVRSCADLVLPPFLELGRSLQYVSHFLPLCRRQWDSQSSIRGPSKE
jgi:hypothetical protein